LGGESFSLFATARPKCPDRTVDTIAESGCSNYGCASQEKQKQTIILIKSFREACSLKDYARGGAGASTLRDS